MLFSLYQSSQTSVSVWLAVALALIAVSGTYLATWMGRKRRSTVRAENDELSARTHKQQIESIGDLLDDLRQTRVDLGAMGREISAMRAENTFLRGQITWHEEISIRARQAAHAAINEVQRGALAIMLRDDSLKENKAAIRKLEDLLTGANVNFIQCNLEDPPPFKAKQYSEILNYQALPLPPAGEQ